MKILALDISSSTIGWSILSKDNNDAISLDDYGHIKPLTKKKANGSLSMRLLKTSEAIESLISEKNPDLVVIEDYARKFSSGRSSANTIILLAVFNESIALSAYKITGKDVIRHTVTSLRAFVNKRHSVKVKDKDDVINFVKSTFPSFTPMKNKNGNIKKETEDEADSILLGYYHLIK